MEGYYNNTIFHRLVSGFIIQGGDPTGTGMGGQSIWDEPFSDEFHSRLRYNRRGLVGMANTSKNDNGSQFFITLAPTPELQGKNTLFGRVVGNSIYNVLRMAELETDKNERPLYPPKILSTEVLLNPFDDIIPRTTEEDRRKRAELFVSLNENFKNKPKKNKVLLSFQDEETNEEICKLSKFKSSHDIGDDVKLSEQPVIITSVKRKQDILDETKETQIVTKDVKDVENETKSPSHSTLSVEKLGKKDSSDSKKTKMEEIQEQIHILKGDIKAISKKKSKYSDSKESEKEKLLSYLEKEKERYRASEKAIVGSKGKSKKVREEETLAKLSLFQSKISSKNCIEIEEEEEEEKDACELHGVPGCFSCFDRLGEHNDLPDENNSDWFAKRLVFAKDKLGKDHTFSASRVDDFEIIDPRERKERAIFEEKMKKKKYEISKSFKPNYKRHS